MHANKQSGMIKQEWKYLSSGSVTLKCTNGLHWGDVKRNPKCRRENGQIITEKEMTILIIVPLVI